MISKIKTHIIENIRVYLVLSILFIIGLSIGIFFVNNSNDVQKLEISNYINDFMNKVKEQKINYFLLLKNSAKKNLKLLLITIFVSMSAFSTIGNVAICLYKGFSTGYTLSSMIQVLGVLKGIGFGSSLILLSHIILIPTLFYTMVSTNVFYKKLIMQDFNNKKVEIIQFVFLVLISSGLMFLASLVETFVGSNLFLSLINI